MKMMLGLKTRLRPKLVSVACARDGLVGKEINRLKKIWDRSRD